MIKLRFEDSGYINKPQFFTFPDGTRHVILVDQQMIVPEGTDITIIAQVSSPNDVIDIALTADAVRRFYKHGNLNLYIPYFPGSRQDRVVNQGEALSVKVYADIINNLYFDVVKVLDPHSEAVGAALNDALVMKPIGLYSTVAQDIDPQNTVVVSPDAGAKKRASFAAVQMGVDTVLSADKERNLKTGDIIDFNLYADKDQVEGKTAVIVDDIVTNGGTFIPLVDILRSMGAEKVFLCVTHADHKEGLFKMQRVFDKVYTTNSKSEHYNENNLTRNNLTVVSVY